MYFPIVLLSTLVYGISLSELSSILFNCRRNHKLMGDCIDTISWDNRHFLDNNISSILGHNSTRMNNEMVSFSLIFRDSKRLKLSLEILHSIETFPIPPVSIWLPQQNSRFMEEQLYSEFHSLNIKYYMGPLTKNIENISARSRTSMFLLFVDDGRYLSNYTLFKCIQWYLLVSTEFTTDWSSL
jgi:hypothetical protein